MDIPDLRRLVSPRTGTGSTGSTGNRVALLLRVTAVLPVLRVSLLLAILSVLGISALLLAVRVVLPLLLLLPGDEGCLSWTELERAWVEAGGLLAGHLLVEKERSK